MTHDELLKYLNERLSWENGTETGNAYSALLTIVELHIPYAPAFVDIDLSKGGGTCFHCSVDIKENSLAIPYPCPTIEAIEKELG